MVVVLVALCQTTRGYIRVSIVEENVGAMRSQSTTVTACFGVPTKRLLPSRKKKGQGEGEEEEKKREEKKKITGRRKGGGRRGYRYNDTGFLLPSRFRDIPIFSIPIGVLREYGASDFFPIKKIVKFARWYTRISKKSSIYIYIFSR